VGQSVKCLTTDWTTGVQSPAQASSFCVQISYEVHPASSIGYRGSFPGRKAQQGRDANRSHQSSAEVKNE
jgi:hypothetical protein